MSLSLRYLLKSSYSSRNIVTAKTKALGEGSGLGGESALGGERVRVKWEEREWIRRRKSRLGGERGVDWEERVHWEERE